jgi:hypothetical protein
MFRVLMLAATLQDPRALCHNEFEARAVAAGAAMCAGGVIGKAMPTHTAAL